VDNIETGAIHNGPFDHVFVDMKLCLERLDKRGFMDGLEIRHHVCVLGGPWYAM
jgi:hypothetical protein